LRKVIGADLVAQTARAAMDQDGDLIGLDADCGGGFGVVNALDVLNF
jgi:hypothetical protein